MDCLIFVIALHRVETRLPVFANASGYNGVHCGTAILSETQLSQLIRGTFELTSGQVGCPLFCLFPRGKYETLAAVSAVHNCGGQKLVDGRVAGHLGAADGLQGSHCTWKTWKNRSIPGKPGKTGGFGAKTWKNIAKPGKKF